MTTPQIHPNRRSVLATLGTTLALGGAGCSGRSRSDPEDDKLALPSVVTSGELPDGDVVLLPDDTVTLLNFFATWCKPCVDEMPAFRRLRSEYDPETLHMVSITPEVDEDLIKAFWQEHDGTWPVVNDPALKATDRWEANSYPTNLLFDQDGTQVSDGHGIRAREFEALNAKIKPLIENQ
jgi:thiol-disulfide isomerase/thioredoxin